MSNLSSLVRRYSTASEEDMRWLHLLVPELQLIADLSLADMVVWVPTPDGSFIAVAHSRPSSAATLFYRDFIGMPVRAEWSAPVRQAFDECRTVAPEQPAWVDEMATQLQATPIVRRESVPGTAETRSHVVGVITRHRNLSDYRMSGRQELTFREYGEELLTMIANGDFPDPDAPPAPRRGAPRANDGLVGVDEEGIVTFASPNSLSAIQRIGFHGELEGESLAEVVSELLQGRMQVDESLPLVVTARAPWRADIDTRGVTISMRAIPLRRGQERVGGIVLMRDVTEVRHQEHELITKDATIREIHHRVKNNLQTVAALLRMQARRSTTEEAKDMLGQAMRRVSAIALVHDTLSTGLDQDVDFDEVFERVVVLIAEVAVSGPGRVRPVKEGSFGVLPSEVASPLALALTEIATNAVEHGLDGREDGELIVRATRHPDHLEVDVLDNGRGIDADRVGQGLGTQIIRTLIEGELGGSIAWTRRAEGGTHVRVTVPFRWMGA